MRLRMLKFSQRCVVHDVKFRSSSVERVEHVAKLARASRLVLTVKAEAVTQKSLACPCEPKWRSASEIYFRTALHVLNREADS